MTVSALHDFFLNTKKYIGVPITPATNKNKHMYIKTFKTLLKPLLAIR